MKLKRLVLATIPLVTVAACGTYTMPRMPIPPDLVGAEIIDVSNRTVRPFVDESFDLGRYKVRNVDRGFHITTGSGLGGLMNYSGRQGIGFRFSGEQEWNGRCDLTSHDTTLEAREALLVLGSHAHLSCHCDGPHESVQLNLDDNSDFMQGDMTLSPGVHYSVRQVGYAVNQPLKAPGYRVERASGQAVAAVDLLYPGRLLRLAELPVEQKEPQACLLSGLIVYGMHTL